MAYALRALAYGGLEMDAEAQRDLGKAADLGYDVEDIRRELERLKGQ